MKGRHPFILAAKTNLGCVDDAIAAWTGLVRRPGQMVDTMRVRNRVRRTLPGHRQGTAEDAGPLRLYCSSTTRPREGQGPCRPRAVRGWPDAGQPAARGCGPRCNGQRAALALPRPAAGRRGPPDRVLPGPGRAERATRHSGFFAFLCNLVDKTPAELLDLYGMRDVQEKSFDTIKTGQNGRRLRTSTELSNDGSCSPVPGAHPQQQDRARMIDKACMRPIPPEASHRIPDPIRSIERPTGSAHPEMHQAPAEVFEHSASRSPYSAAQETHVFQARKKAKTISLSYSKKFAEFRNQLHIHFTDPVLLCQ